MSIESIENRVLSDYLSEQDKLYRIAELEAEIADMEVDLEVKREEVDVLRGETGF